MKTDIFTVKQAATYLKVTPHAVTRWFNRGQLRGYRIPGSQQIRIPREYLVKFMNEHGLPLGELAEPPTGEASSEHP